MNNISALLFVCLAAQCILAAKQEFDYNSQKQWPGVCVQGQQQSPIDISTSNVVVDSSLSSLKFNAWDVSYPGTFLNNGHMAQFTPTTPGAATTINHLGKYSLDQFHVHWGRRTGEGSEHTFNGNEAELEIHFVHTKSGATDVTQKDYYTVVAVLADVGEGATSPWDKLDVTKIQSNTSSPVNVNNGFVFDQLLPNNRDYYYYKGSLTAPPCNETVQWFVLKERISVPQTFLAQLREFQGKNGDIIDFNFRAIQKLEGRTVMTASQAINKPYIFLLMLSLLLQPFFLKV